MNVYEIRTMGDRLCGNPYVGRGLIVGTSLSGRYAAHAYFLMGRSANSRNRVLALRDGAVFTEPFDPEKVEDPRLIIYAAVRSWENRLIVTNGDQTDTICDGLKRGVSFRDALATREFEPDKPNFTPRISSISTFESGTFHYEMSILKSIDPVGSDCARYTFSYNAKPGLGHFLHTYVTDGDPIPSFQGEPERVSIPDDMEAFARDIWENLNEENRIALYVRYTELSGGAIRQTILNKNR